MKKAKGVVALLLLCTILCGTTRGSELYSQPGKDVIGVLSFLQDSDNY